jgi:APA family basic amino acid/polyamine antiporter
MSLGILRLRKQLGSPKKGEFQVPFVPLLPIISVISCVFLMTRFSAVTWIVFGITIALGLLIYFVYGYQHSHLNKK